MTKLISMAVLFVALAGCGGDDPSVVGDGGSCDVPATSVVEYQDCSPTCVAQCGQLPDDGSPGTLLPVGCTVSIGTSQPRTAMCVRTCADCPSQ